MEADRLFFFFLFCFSPIYWRECWTDCHLWWLKLFLVNQTFGCHETKVAIKSKEVAHSLFSAICVRKTGLCWHTSKYCPIMPEWSLSWLAVILQNSSIFLQCITVIWIFHLPVAKICWLMLSHVKISSEIWTASARLVSSLVLHIPAQFMMYYMQINI